MWKIQKVRNKPKQEDHKTNLKKGNLHVEMLGLKKNENRKNQKIMATMKKNKDKKPKPKPKPKPHLACCYCLVTPENGTMVCKRCGVQRYCSRECQLHDWKKHQPVCKRMEPQCKKTPDLSLLAAKRIRTISTHPELTLVMEVCAFFIRDAQPKALFVIPPVDFAAVCSSCSKNAFGLVARDYKNKSLTAPSINSVGYVAVVSNKELKSDSSFYQPGHLLQPGGLYTTESFQEVKKTVRKTIREKLKSKWLSAFCKGCVLLVFDPKAEKQLSAYPLEI
jgi:MYND finger